MSIEKILVEKNIEKKNVEPKKIKISKISINIFFFDPKIFLIFIFDRKKYLFSELEKKKVHSFDVEFWELSIYEVFRAFPALLDVFWSLLAYGLVWGILL